MSGRTRSRPARSRRPPACPRRGTAARHRVQRRSRRTGEAGRPGRPWSTHPRSRRRAGPAPATREGRPPGAGVPILAPDTRSSRMPAPVTRGTSGSGTTNRAAGQVSAMTVQTGEVEVIGVLVGREDRTDVQQATGSITARSLGLVVATGTGRSVRDRRRPGARSRPVRERRSRPSPAGIARRDRRRDPTTWAGAMGDRSRLTNDAIDETFKRPASPRRGDGCRRGPVGDGRPLRRARTRRHEGDRIDDPLMLTSSVGLAAISRGRPGVGDQDVRPESS